MDLTSTEQGNTLLDEFLSERFFSFQSRISSITKGEIDKDDGEFEIMPLMTDQNDKDIIDRIKLISHYTKVDPSALDTIDLFLYCSERKAYGRKIVNQDGDIVSHQYISSYLITIAAILFLKKL